MKLVCYGASVTAQTNETGYVQQLMESSCAKYFSSIEKVAFGASQFEYAGYSFMQDVLDQKPDICVIDWLTPSMPGFNAFKIDLLNYALLAQDCLPIWVFFPRINNFENVPNSFEQVKVSANKFSIDLLDLRSEMPDFRANAYHYLRDDVHTTQAGAKCYSNKISRHVVISLLNIKERIAQARESEGFKETLLKNYSIPLIKPIQASINSQQIVEIDFNYDGGFFEVYFDTEIGPHICYLDFKLYKEGELFYDETFNKVDPWCYYNRSMIIETLRKRIPEGSYKLVISKGIGNPFTEKETRKPVEELWDESDRFILIKRISVTTPHYELSINRSDI